MIYNLIVFDWDGTLMDSMAAIVFAIQQSARDLHLREPTEREAKNVIGLGLTEAFQHVWPELEKGQYPDLIHAYRQNYLKNDGALGFYAGIFPLLEILKKQGKTLAVATGKSRVGLNRALKNTQSAAFFALTKTADECFSKPHPQMLLEIMEELNFSPKETLMVGDSIHDVLMAHSAQVDCAAVSYGAFSKEELAKCNPRFLCGSVVELAEVLAK